MHIQNDTNQAPFQEATEGGHDNFMLLLSEHAMKLEGLQCVEIMVLLYRQFDVATST